MAALVAIAAAVVGCAASSGASSAGVSPGATERASETVTEPSVSGSLPAVVLDPILADAAARTGAPKRLLEIVTAEPRTWPDGSLGCPQPGMAYPQMVVDGYRVVVRAGSRTLDYRGSAPGRFVLCEPVSPS